ncbi:CYTH domain-containing protein [uncultured Draconibacterium sp.]|uniref:CYTH domain-containing protein n=1 Tax=uncultured Draconibacterium sp. TaxID=1573823 RepID=UPI003217D3C5
METMLEIERKYLIDLDKWEPKNKGLKIKQGYLSVDKERVVRIRTKKDKAYLTIKGNQQGITRTELEYEVPVSDAETMLRMCLNFPIEKTRYLEKIGGLLWEIDVFEGENSGLYLAEVELEDENQTIELPDWIIKEVSYDHRYFNSWLSQNPFSKW